MTNYILTTYSGAISHRPFANDAAAMEFKIANKLRSVRPR